MARELTYWTKTLADLPDRIALPVDHPTPARPSRRGGTLAFAIESELHRRLQTLARQLGASLFMVLQAGLAALLTRLGSGPDIPLGSPVAGRTDAVLDELVGLFVNTLVLRTDTSGNPSFAELVDRVRRTNLAAYDHQALPFERLVEALQPSRTLSRHPLFQVMLAFESEQPPLLELAGLRSRPQPVTMPRAQFDLALGLVERRGPDGAPAGIAGVIDYAADLFEPAGIERLLARLLRLLQGAAEHPERRIGALEILDAAERATILQVWSGALPPPDRNSRKPELAGAVCGPGAAHAGCAGGAVRRAAPELRRARRRGQPPGASSAWIGRGAGDRGRALPGALDGGDHRAARHPQGRRGLSAARPGRSAGAAVADAGRCPCCGAGDAAIAAGTAAGPCP